MFENYLNSIGGIDILSISVTILFFVMFVTIIIWIFRADKGYLKKMENLPLDEES
jgi:cbb3-type cytochrome oxidase subunit 3